MMSVLNTSAPRAPLVRYADPEGPAAGDAAAWAAAHREHLRALVTEHGAVVVRGLGIADPDTAAMVFAALSDRLVLEREGFAARRPVTGAVYPAAPWPPQQSMCHHHELSYLTEPPGLLLFACLRAPTSGGATTLADASALLTELPPDLVARFEAEGWLLLRSYGGEVGPSLADAFGTDDRAAIEHYCRSRGIDLAWQPDGGLRTSQRRPAVRRHPVTGKRCWFNQIGFLSEWTLDPEVREFLIELHGEDGLPFATRFGGGDPVPEDVVRLLDRTYADHSTAEPWRAGDLLLVDNVRTAHGRESYTGEREVLAALADPLAAGGWGR